MAIGRLFDTTYNVGLLLYDLYYAPCPAHTICIDNSVVHNIEATELQHRGYC